MLGTGPIPKPASRIICSSSCRPSRLPKRSLNLSVVGTAILCDAWLTCLKHFLNRFGMFGDYRQEHPCGGVRARPALFPIAERRRWEAEFRRELCLAQPHPPSHNPNINVRYLDQGYANSIIVPACPGHRLLQSLNDSFPCSGAPSSGPRLYFRALY
jgi:hypothetical protein